MTPLGSPVVPDVKTDVGSLLGRHVDRAEVVGVLFAGPEHLLGQPFV